MERDVWDEETDEERDRLSRAREREAERRVGEGIIWLGLNHPDWRKNIDLRNFNFAFPTSCALGQSIGWTVGNELIDDQGLSVYDLGFDAAGDGEGEDPGYKELSDAWEAAFRADPLINKP